MNTPTTTIRITEKTHRALHSLAREVGTPMAEVVDQALELFRRQLLLNQANAAYAALRADPDGWVEVQAERAAWDATLVDGLEER